MRKVQELVQSKSNPRLQTSAKAEQYQQMFKPKVSVMFKFLYPQNLHVGFGLGSRPTSGKNFHENPFHGFTNNTEGKTQSPQ